MRERAGLLAVAVAAVGVLAPGGPARGAEADAFLAGYASAVLERELDVRAGRVSVSGGVATVHGAGVGAADEARVAAALSALEGIDEVRFAAAGAAEGEPGFDLLPPGGLFDPLQADPRWPHFSASYQRYVGDEELGNVAAVSFGDTIPLLRHAAWGEGSWELVLHAAVFSIFDIDADSFDLVNSDFLVGPAVAWRDGPFSAMLRFFHQSSHLGDEFLLRDTVDRVNLSYEAVDALVSWDVTEGARVYAGGGWIVRREPEDLQQASVQAGLELRSLRAWAGGHLRPVLALDVQSRQESDWDLDLSARAGIQVESPRLGSKRLQVLLDWFQGRSPNGQLFERKIEYWALGAHLHF